MRPYRRPSGLPAPAAAAFWEPCQSKQVLCQDIQTAQKRGQETIINI